MRARTHTHTEKRNHLPQEVLVKEQGTNKLPPTRILQRSTRGHEEPACQCRRHKRCGFDPSVEKKMATHSSVLAWRIPGMGEPGGLPSMGSHIVGHPSCCAFTHRVAFEEGSGPRVFIPLPEELALLPACRTCSSAKLKLTCLGLGVLPWAWSPALGLH